MRLLVVLLVCWATTAHAVCDARALAVDGQPGVWLTEACANEYLRAVRERDALRNDRADMEALDLIRVREIRTATRALDGALSQLSMSQDNLRVVLVQLEEERNPPFYSSKLGLYLEGVGTVVLIGALVWLLIR